MTEILNPEWIDAYDRLLPTEADETKVAADDGCICQGNWRQIIKESVPLFGHKFLSDDDGKIYTFFGVVHGADDYYYGMSDSENKILLLSCAGSFENYGFQELVKKNG